MSDTQEHGDHGAWRRLKIPAGQTAEEARIEQNLQVPDPPAEEPTE